MNIKKNELCPDCLKKKRKADTEYMKGRRLKQRAEKLKKEGLLKNGND